MDEQTFTLLMGTWKIAGVAPSPVLRTMADTFGRVARIKCKVTLSQDDVAAQQSQQLAAQAAAVAAQAATAAAQQLAIVAASAPPLRKGEW